MGREQVSELLVAAALRGQKQITGTWRDAGDGRCAVGVLLDDLPEAWMKMPGDSFSKGLTVGMPTREYAAQSYGLTCEEISRIINMNDDQKLDFLTIARKWENPDNA